MVKKKSSKKKSSHKKVSKKSSQDNEKSFDSGSCFSGNHPVSWYKIAATLIAGALLGMYFGNSTIDVSTIFTFISIVMTVLVLALILDMRRHILAM